MADRARRWARGLSRGWSDVPWVIGAPVRIEVGLAGDEVMVARLFVAQVGRVPLLLLDTDLEENSPALRDVTDRLYGGTTEHRLRQELLLGVGGVRAVRAWSRTTGAPAPEVFHTNEGHAGFLGVERLRELTADPDGPGLDLDAALEVTRAATVFTTHTPVPAGIDRFPRELVEQYVSSGGPVPGVPAERVLAPIIPRCLAFRWEQTSNSNRCRMLSREQTLANVGSNGVSHSGMPSWEGPAAPGVRAS